MEGDSTCWEQVLSRGSGSVYESSLCSTGVCAGGCMVGLSQGCMHLVQGSGTALLVKRKQLNNINHQHHMVECIFLARFRFSVATADTGPQKVVSKTNVIVQRVHPFTTMEPLVWS